MALVELAPTSTSLPRSYSSPTGIPATPSPSPTPSMKQNIIDGQTKAHLAQVQLLTGSLKEKLHTEEDTNGGYVNPIEETGNLSPPELRRRSHLEPPASDDSRTVSLNSIDFAQMISQQQQSLQQLASQHHHHHEQGLPNGLANGVNGLKRGSNTMDGCNNKMTEKEITVQMQGLDNGTADGQTNLEPSGESNNNKAPEPKGNSWAHIRRLLAGVSLTLLSAFFFSVTTVIVKFVGDIKPSQMALFRYIGILVLSYPVVLESGEKWFGENSWWFRFWMVLRGLSGCTCLFFRYSAVKYISLADTTIICLSMPVFVFIFARIFLGEHFGRWHVVSLVLSIVGIAFASKIETFFNRGGNGGELLNATTTTMMPDSLFNSTTTMASNLTTVAPDVAEDGSHNQLIGTLFAVGAMVIGSMVYITVRKMRKTHQSVILFNFALIAIAEMTVINYIFYDFKLPDTGYSAYLVTILAVLSFYGQMLLTKAIQLEEAGVVSVVRVSGEAFFAFVFQITIFGEVPDLYTILGAILVLSAVFLLSFRKYICSLEVDSPTRKKFAFIAK